MENIIKNQIKVAFETVMILTDDSSWFITRKNEFPVNSEELATISEAIANSLHDYRITSDNVAEIIKASMFDINNEGEEANEYSDWRWNHLPDNIAKELLFKQRA